MVGRTYCIMTFEIELDGRACQVELSQPNGNSGSYFIMIDNFFHGQMFKRNGVWAAGLAAKSWIGMGDVREIGERLDGAQ